MEDNVAAWVFTIGAVVFVIILIINETAKGRAKKAYEESLEKLKRNPNSPYRRENALRLGRAYSDLIKKTKGRGVLDELALMNDINAACARATIGQDTVAKVEVTNPVFATGQSVTKEIEKLGQLFLAGVITAEEFERGKTLFLGAPPNKAASAVELLQDLNALKEQGVISESEFNIKKWDILSERLLPGRLNAAKLQRGLTEPH